MPRLVLFFVVFVLYAPAGIAQSLEKVVPMVDPAIDATGPFCYLAKSTTTIGVMAAPKAAQVTFDGAIFTGEAELCFFYGEPLCPVLARQKQLLDGWLPIVLYSWNDGAIEYSIEMFAATLDGDPLSNPIQFVRARMRNTGSAPARGCFASALRMSGKDHRFEHMRPYAFEPEWRYEMTKDSVYRNERLALVFSEGGRLEAVPGVAYTQPFQGIEYDLTERAESCLVRYEAELPPLASREMVFKMPLRLIPRETDAEIQALRAADYNTYRRKTIAFWKAELAKGTQITIPEKKVLDTHRASLMYDWIAIWQKDGQWVQGVNKYQYNWFWLRDGAYILRTYDLLGHHETSRKCLEYFRRFQQPDGNFASQKGQMDGFGQALFALGQHALITDDREFAREIYPHFPPAVKWLEQARADDPFRLMPKTEARDNEYIIGHYTGHNFWALLGLRTGIRLARFLGKESDARAFQAEYDDFYAALMRKLDEVAGTDGYIPPGLDAEGGQDWGNLIGVYPAEVLAPFDPRVTTTLAKMRRDKYHEGLMTYMGRLHQYLTIKSTQNYVARGEQKRALEDFYQFLLHTGSTHEGFEWQAVPWGARDVGGNFPPHGWGAAMFNALLRNMLVRESGGKGGLEPRDIHLFSVLSPAWAIPGEEVAIYNAPTEMGPLSASMKFTETGAEITIEPKFRTPPRRIHIQIPYFVTLDTFEADARAESITNGAIVFPPTVTKVTLHWTRKPVLPMSYEHAVEVYKREYARRYADYRAAGYEPVPVEAPALLTAEERKAEFKRPRAERDVNLATGKPVTVSGGTERGHNPELAVDGYTSNKDVSSWWAANAPQWLQVDLGKAHRIGSVKVYPYWDGERYYQYTVEVSTDAAQWIRVVDRSKNIRPATAEGDLHKFDPLEARYVRVHILYNSANPSVHLVELKVYEATP